MRSDGKQDSIIGSVQGGRYRILEKIGEGGMGEVYLAEHMNLGRRDAIKMIRRDLAGDPEFVSRFRREARATNRLQHPNIISIYDFGRGSEGRYFLAMEYAKGVPLHHVIAQEGPLPVERALHLLLQLSSAVDHAHARGVVHRDLRPENLMVDANGKDPDQLKVLDFGLAKILTPDDRDAVILSLRGQVFGTPAYMSPEQFQGIMADPRSDIYAMGCLGFEMLVGKPPFLGRPVEVMCAQATKMPERPRKLRPHGRIPERFEELIMRCLEKDPARRFQTSHELLNALERVASDIESRRPSYSTRTRRRMFRSDFDCADTDVTPPPGAYAAAFDRDASVEQDWKKMVRLFAESLMDGGANDLRLVMHVTELRQAEGDLSRTDAELATIDKQLSRIEQAAREREGTLRFAIGELVFARQELTVDPSGKAGVQAGAPGPGDARLQTRPTRPELTRTEPSRTDARKDTGRAASTGVGEPSAKAGESAIGKSVASKAEPNAPAGSAKGAAPTSVTVPPLPAFAKAPPVPSAAKAPPLPTAAKAAAASANFKTPAPAAPLATPPPTPPAAPVTTSASATATTEPTQADETRVDPPLTAIEMDGVIDVASMTDVAILGTNEDIDRQIAELEERLAASIADFARQTEGVTERAIQFAAERSLLEDKIERLYLSLDAWIVHIVEVTRPRVLQHDEIKKVGERWRVLRKSRQRSLSELKRAEAPVGRQKGEGPG